MGGGIGIGPRRPNTAATAATLDLCTFNTHFPGRIARKER